MLRETRRDTDPASTEAMRSIEQVAQNAARDDQVAARAFNRMPSGLVA